TDMEDNNLYSDCRYLAASTPGVEFVDDLARLAEVAKFRHRLKSSHEAIAQQFESETRDCLGRNSYPKLILVSIEGQLGCRATVEGVNADTAISLELQFDDPSLGT